MVNHFKICGTMKVKLVLFIGEGNSFRKSIELAVCEICFENSENVLFVLNIMIQLLVYDFFDIEF